MTDSFDEFKRLMQAKRYDEAREILLNLDHPKKHEWLARVDKIIATAQTQPPVQLKRKQNTPLPGNYAGKKSLPNIADGINIGERSWRTTLVMFALPVVIILLVGSVALMAFLHREGFETTLIRGDYGYPFHWSSNPDDFDNCQEKPDTCFSMQTFDDRLGITFSD